VFVVTGLQEMTMTSEWAVEADNLVKRFAQRKSADAPEAAEGRAPRRWPWSRRAPASLFTAVDGVSFQIARGEVFGLLGPNGAGKSTTIRMLCTLLEPTSGTARVAGFDVQRQANLVRQNLGTVLAGERSIYWKLTGRENLEYFAALYHVPPAVARRRVDELLERMELTARAGQLVETYSTGMKQRVVLARALLARPPILLLDEPTLGLDPQAARRVRELVTELKAEGHTILLTTHYMEEADLLSDRIGIIDQGRIIALDTPAALKQRIGQRDALRLEVAGWQPELAGRLQQVPGVAGLATRYLGTDSVWELSLQAQDGRAALPNIIEQLGRGGSRIVNLKVAEPTLEDVFIQLTGKALRD
jgi:ABC-2 type transport system ATP-binding protein